MALHAGTRLGAYEVLSLLGPGGMGEVYRARDTRLDREVAVKVLTADRVSDADRRRHFVQDAQPASALSHPRIITIYDRVGQRERLHRDGVRPAAREKSLDALIPRQGCA
jgi:serine/threonine protein kinase